MVGSGAHSDSGLSFICDGRGKDKEEMSQGLSSTLNEVNDTLESYERLTKIVIMNEVWSIENGLLTPSLKLKRAELEKRHLSQYGEWFSHSDSVVWQY